MQLRKDSSCSYLGRSAQQAIGKKITSEALVNKCLGFLECIAQRERTRCNPIALTGVTLLVIKQKSADGIVAKRPS